VKHATLRESQEDTMVWQIDRCRVWRGAVMTGTAQRAFDDSKYPRLQGPVAECRRRGPARRAVPGRAAL